MKAKDLAQLLLQEREPPASHVETQQCFACGRSFLRTNGRFCSSRCGDAFDAGLPPYERIAPRFDLPLGTSGFRVACKNCDKVFDSRGLRCCSADCEREYRRKLELETELQRQTFRAVKPRCLECDRPMKLWRDGRRVSRRRLFCSDRCRKRRARNAQVGIGARTSNLSAKSAKKCPQNGPSHMRSCRPSTAIRRAA